MPFAVVVIENDRSRRSVAANPGRHRAVSPIHPADHPVPLPTRAGTTGAPQGSAERLQTAARRDGALWDKYDAAEAVGGWAAGERA